MGAMKKAGFDAKLKPVPGKQGLMVVNTLGQPAEKNWNHSHLTVSYAFVVVKLMAHSAQGITEKELALAEKIEEVLWDTAGTSRGVFEGTPDDPRFKYIKQDK